MNGRKQSDYVVKLEWTQTINAPVQEVFPLACPVMEYKWIPGWKCELIHCPNGHTELGCIFNEIFSAPLLTDSVTQKTTWTAVLYEPDKHCVYYQLQNAVSSSLYKIEFEAEGSVHTKNRLEITYTPLAERGIRNMENGGEGKLKFMLSTLSLMLKHYCEQGKIIKSAEIKKLVLHSKHITFKVRLKLILNDIMMRFVQDNDRKRFQKGLPITRTKAEPFH